MFVVVFKLPPVKDPPGFNISPSKVTTLNLWLVSFASFIPSSILSITIVLPNILSIISLYFSSKETKSLATFIYFVFAFIVFSSILLDFITFIGRKVTLPILFFFR